MNQHQKKISIVGSTGSIGRQALQVALHLDLEVTCLAVKENIDLLFEQIQQFHPKVVAVFDRDKAAILQKKVSIPVLAGLEGLEEVSSHPDVDTCLLAMSGAIGIAPTVAAIQSGKTIALANKEVLVSAGAWIMQMAREKQVPILPVDSEHSAIFQCLRGENIQEVRKIILTASGGPFFHLTQEERSQITVERALTHPNWKMGPKITIDSSTLMNKGLEVIEAAHLFHKSPDDIEVVIHPQSLIHSMVEMQDGSILAQMSEPSMLLPIQYAFTWPKREKGMLAPFSFAKHSKLTFFPAEKGHFLCLDLAYAALKEGQSVPCFLNAANEVLVSRFLQRDIHWLDIGAKLEKLLERHQKEQILSLEAVFAVDALAREQAKAI